MADNKKYVELLWADKYDKYQKGEKTPIEKPNLPFQVIETVNEPRAKDLQINISDKEKTIIDCLNKPQYCGGVIEVAKALKNENLDREKLSEYAQRIGNSGVIRRLGYLCDFLGIDIDIYAIETRNYPLLDPTMPHKGSKNAKWRLIVNMDEKMLGKLE